jgi:hypothetical protein
MHAPGHWATCARLLEVALVEKIEPGLKFRVAKNHRPAQGLDRKLKEGL